MKMNASKICNFLLRERFTVIALVWGLLFSVIIIPWQTPDEYNHLNMIGESFGNSELAPVLFDEMYLSRYEISFHEEVKINFSDILNAMKQPAQYDQKVCMPKKITISALKHLPAALGVYTGILFHLPVYFVLTLGEVCSLIFYILVCRWALKIVPFKKYLLEIIMLLPMCIQQASSINYDAVLLPLCFLLYSYILYLKFKITKIGIKELSFIIFTVALITLIKMPYALMLFLICLLPLDKIDIRIGRVSICKATLVKYKILILLIITLLSCLVLYMFKNNEYFVILGAEIRNFRRTVYLLVQSYTVFTEYLYTSLIGDFGYLDTEMPMWFVTTVICSVLMFSHINIEEDNTKYTFSKPEKLFCYVYAFIFIILITLSMTRHTIGIILFGDESYTEPVDYDIALYQIPYIGGFQGRYYLPVLGALLLPNIQIFKISKKNLNILLSIYYLFTIICTSIKICDRYFY